MTRHRILIVGAGGFGREILAWVDDVIQAGTEPTWEFGGFLDANPKALAKFPSIHAPIVGDPATYRPQPHDRLICAIGDPATKLAVCRQLQNVGAEFASLIHPTAMVGPRCTYGPGLIMCPRAIATVDIQIGEFVTLNCRASLGHDVVVGDGCTFNSYSDVTGGARIGEGVMLGSHAVIMPRAVVGEYARIGAGSVVLRRVKPHASVLGVPARRIDFGDSDVDSRAA